MMIARELRPSDIEQLREIHARFYKDEFEFPNFFNKFICAFAIIDNDKIITAGGLKPIAESILITNKDFSMQERIQALTIALDISRFLANKSNFNQVHAFVQEPVWEAFLNRVGFTRCKGNALYLNLE